MTFVIEGVLPGLNDMVAACRKRYRGGASAYSTLKKEVEMRIVMELRSQRISPVRKYPVMMTYRWVEPNRRRDKSNIAAGGRKFIEDALVVAGILQGDGWKHIAGFTDEFAVDRRNPRVEVWFD